MKRFFCIICQRVKRVHSLPHGVIEHEKPHLRLGTCGYHTAADGLGRTLRDRVKAHKVVTHRPKAAQPAPEAPKKGRKGRRPDA